MARTSKSGSTVAMRSSKSLGTGRNMFTRVLDLGLTAIGKRQARRQRKGINRNRRLTRVTLHNRWRYNFDKLMSKGLVPIVVVLNLIAVAFLCLMATVLTIFHIQPEGGNLPTFIDRVWSALLHSINPGTMNGAQGWPFRITMLVTTYGGLVLMGTLTGVIINSINNKLESLRKGRSRVIETDHIVILGWSPQVFTIISELAIANANQPYTCIVILSKEDKVDMDDSLREAFRKLRKIKIVCRTGNPSSMADLGIVNIQAARSIIILNPADDHSDSQVVKTLLAITNIPRALRQPYHLVTEVTNPKILDVLQTIGGNQIETILVRNVISRILVQTARQSGLSAVYMELLDFDNDEIYFHAEPSLEGKTYGQALLAYNDSTVIGIKHLNGTVTLNPPNNTSIAAGDQLVIIAEDDDRMEISGLSQVPVDRKAIKDSSQPRVVQPENTLILGWSDRLSCIMQEMDKYVVTGSRLTIVADFPEAESTFESQSLGLHNLTLKYQQGDSTSREVLEQLNLQQYQQVIVLSNTALDPDRADAQTLVTLLYLREIAKRNHYKFRIVTEMLDSRNQSLAQVAQPDDFVIGEQIISLMLTQIAEQKEINGVFNDLFDPEGSEIYLKPISDYI
ncbi:CASTOR/POLLUX-related putative ion channel, partial [Allocoleopsis sp.]|uniref:CASTOR/POLLUX-related putative ion channel n=1 Tax=Allocoleopsis sp. TaxID=3088169 RepID=UPI002FD13CF7